MTSSRNLLDENLIKSFCYAAIGSGIVMLCLLLSGCSIEANTATPNAKQVATCRKLMGISPQLEIEPIGYYSISSLDDFHRFKFVAKTDDPTELFDESIDSSKFVQNYKDREMDRGTYSSWWKLPQTGLSGGRFPVKRSGISWGQDIWFRVHDDGTITVYTVMESG